MSQAINLGQIDTTTTLAAARELMTTTQGSLDIFDQDPGLFGLGAGDAFDRVVRANLIVADTFRRLSEGGIALDPNLVQEFQSLQQRERNLALRIQQASQSPIPAGAAAPAPAESSPPPLGYVIVLGNDDCSASFDDSDDDSSLPVSRELLQGIQAEGGRASVLSTDRNSPNSDSSSVSPASSISSLADSRDEVDFVVSRSSSRASFSDSEEIELGSHEPAAFTVENGWIIVPGIDSNAIVADFEIELEDPRRA